MVYQQFIVFCVYYVTTERDSSKADASVDTTKSSLRKSQSLTVCMICMRNCACHISSP